MFDLVKVTFRPWKEVIIHECIQDTLEELIHLQSMGIQAGGLARPLNWSNEVVFTYSVMAPTDDIIKEQLKGKVHWTGIRWATMVNYQKVIIIKETNVKIPIIDVSANEILSEVSRFLKMRCGTINQKRTHVRD
jgi:hypothetical protein